MTFVKDISQTLSPALPVWPGDTGFSAERTWTYGPQCPVNVAAMRLSTHSGTHADAPLHYDPAGAAMAEVDLSAYIGHARVVDVRGQGGIVTPAMVAAALTPSATTSPVTRLLFRTYDRFPHDRWASDFTVIDPDAVRLMAARGVVLVGIDSPSIDPQDSKTLAAHHAVRETDMRILEGLVLDDVAAGDYELIALPLKLAGLDASPVRAVLRAFSA
ncbi:arylformamidase [Sphingomonas sp.]|uniref:arylformamidase n=1 Tax=Sphingomonas sp. TaxID=28214 RepID=UPI00289F6C08|nr:arylformamidase [Sphingomonas sp.]